MFFHDAFFSQQIQTVNLVLAVLLAKVAQHSELVAFAGFAILVPLQTTVLALAHLSPGCPDAKQLR